jgi:probable rRNA maturation factor
MRSADYYVQTQLAVEAADDLVAQLEGAVLATLRYLGVEAPAALTVLLADDERLRQLNRDFLGIDRPTDVLSFPDGQPQRGRSATYLGDIAISLPYATRQAVAAGHTISAELQLLVVHGVLHLLGYDHGEPVAKASMWAAQTAVLAQLGLPHIAPTET